MILVAPISVLLHVSTVLSWSLSSISPAYADSLARAAAAARVEAPRLPQPESTAGESDP